jgi:hypothetical protein
MTKKIVRYECEICKNTYTTEAAAKMCETEFPLPPCPVKVGDMVGIITRYNGVEYAEVLEILTHCHMGEFIESWLVEGGPGEDALRERLRTVMKKPRMHRYAVRVKEEHQIGKESWSSIIPDCNVLELQGVV